MRSVRIISLVLSLSLLFCLLTACGGETEAQPQDFTVTVMSEGGAYLNNADVYVYADESREDLVWAGHTDSEGAVSFTAETGKTYVLYLENVPSGYAIKESYSIKKENTDITLKTSLIPMSDAEGVTELGNVFCDFTVTDVNGTTHTLSELLKEKKAVVLNFWYHNCSPCRMEFPHLQKAYEEYSDLVEVIAINPMDGTEESISAYAKELGLTFPMAVGDDYWLAEMDTRGYPTTVVIDRYGTVGFLHSSAVSSPEEFIKLFDYFTSDNYTQTTVRDLSEINDIK